MNRLFLLEIFEAILLGVLIIVPIRWFIFQPFFVRGDSMYPNFSTGDYLIVDELSFRFREPKRGEVVVFRTPFDPRTYYIKRIIGLPGETVKIARGKVSFMNKEYPGGKPLDEEYLVGVETPGDLTVSLKETEYFMLGDNRTSSFDSRRWGAVPDDHIVGRVWIRLWPINSFAVFASP